MLTRRFCSSSVSVTVKRVLFESFCLCMYMYDVMTLWTNFTVKSYKCMTMKACYVKCLKNFVDTVDLSVTTMLAEIDIPDFDSVVNNFGNG